MTDTDTQLVRFAKQVGIMFGAVIAAGTVIQWVGAFLWGNATRPILAIIERQQVALIEERQARQWGDSLLVERLARIETAVAAAAHHERH